MGIVAKPKKDGRNVSFYMARDVLEHLNEYSAKTHIPKTALIEESVRTYLKIHDRQKKDI